MTMKHVIFYTSLHKQPEIKDSQLKIWTQKENLYNDYIIEKLTYDNNLIKSYNDILNEEETNHKKRRLRTTFHEDNKGKDKNIYIYQFIKWPKNQKRLP